MKEEIVKKLNTIRRTAEIILEHQSSRAFGNDTINHGTKTIIDLCKNAIDEIEKGRKEEYFTHNILSTN